MDCLVDTNILLRSADRLHPSSLQARNAMKALFRQRVRLCVAKQSLLEAWVVATRPRDVNGFGYSAQYAASGLAQVKRLFHLLGETDEIYSEWETLVFRYQVLGKTAHDAKLVATMNVHKVSSILTFNTGDFRRYEEIQTIHPNELT